MRRELSSAVSAGMDAAPARNFRRSMTYASNSFTGEPVRSSRELAILIGRPMGLMYSFFQSMPSAW